MSESIGNTSTHFANLELGGEPFRFVSGETLDAIRESTNKAWVLGNDKFKDRLAKKLDRRVAPLPRGRPPFGKG